MHMHPSLTSTRVRESWAPIQKPKRISYSSERSCRRFNENRLMLQPARAVGYVEKQNVVPRCCSILVESLGFDRNAEQWA